MSIESGTEAPFYVFMIPVTSEGNGRNLTKFPHGVNQRYSIPIRKSYVANNDIELFPGQNFDRRGYRVSSGDGMSHGFDTASDNYRRVLMVLDQQDFHRELSSVSQKRRLGKSALIPLYQAWL
jgi:hypothetical protein